MGIIDIYHLGGTQLDSVCLQEASRARSVPHANPLSELLCTKAMAITRPPPTASSQSNGKVPADQTYI